MRRLFFLFFLKIISCNSVKYYEYYYNDNIPEFNSRYAYCTLEVRKDKAIYRGFTNDYVYQGKESINFLYIETAKVDDWNYVSLANFSKLYYYYDYYSYNEQKRIKNNKGKIIEYNVFDGSDLKSNGLSENDKKQLVGFSKKSNIYKRLNKLPEEYHFDDDGLERIVIWFPSELKKLKK